MTTDPTNRQTSENIRNKLQQLKERIHDADSVLILTHDYPDPDCIASAFGVAHLLTFWGISSPVISFGGFIGRAENRAMIRFLNISMVPFVLIEVNDFDKIVMVDSYPGKGNVSLPPSVPVSAVIDHHPPPEDTKNPFFADIRQNIGATSTLITLYLREAGCPIPPQLATALFYGIKTDTGDMRRDVAEEDLSCYKFLFDLIDHKQLSLIVNPDRDIEYFHLLHHATESVIIYGTIGHLHLGQVSIPDYIAEMADLFHRLEKLEWMTCSGIFKNQIFFSIRSKKGYSAGNKAEELARKLGGSGGGHGRVAAGRIPISPQETVNIKMTQFEMLYKDIFNIGTGKPEKLI